MVLQNQYFTTFSTLIETTLCRISTNLLQNSTPNDTYNILFPMESYQRNESSKYQDTAYLFVQLYIRIQWQEITLKNLNCLLTIGYGELRPNKNPDNNYHKILELSSSPNLIIFNNVFYSLRSPKLIKTNLNCFQLPNTT